MKFWKVIIFMVFSLGLLSQGYIYGYTEVKWIWAYKDNPAPKNCFTYFRKTFELHKLPEDGTIRLAADFNAKVWINGHVMRHKMTRYHEKYITAEIINATPYFKIGKNVIVVLHHSWGDIITFQRTGCKHAGLYVESSFINSNSDWKYIKAPQFIEHTEQVSGITFNDHRIRYPQIIDLRKTIADDLYGPNYDDVGWKDAFVVTDGLWPTVPDSVETSGQREHAI